MRWLFCRMKNLLAAFVALQISFFAASAAAEDNVFSAGVFDPIQIVPNDEGIAGVRLNLFYGYNTTLTGFDFAFLGLNRLKSDMKGVQLGLVNWTEGGEQIGAQLGLVSITGGYFKGAQLGWAFNYAKEVRGLQLGIVNYAERLNKGLQLGLVNIAANGFLPVFVIVNFNFE
jgi:opacity protein-like surface antigen